jgi:hypothetical protein
MEWACPGITSKIAIVGMQITAIVIAIKESWKMWGVRSEIEALRIQVRTLTEGRAGLVKQVGYWTADNGHLQQQIKILLEQQGNIARTEQSIGKERDLVVQQNELLQEEKKKLWSQTAVLVILFLHAFAENRRIASKLAESQQKDVNLLVRVKSQGLSNEILSRTYSGLPFPQQSSLASLYVERMEAQMTIFREVKLTFAEGSAASTAIGFAEETLAGLMELYPGRST